MGAWRVGWAGYPRARWAMGAIETRPRISFSRWFQPRLGAGFTCLTASFGAEWVFSALMCLWWR